ncbi:MAG: hypothetical protein HY318_11905 [Armatimonadetes bacterium]|nr:hypothetical protein [Armatimonadota bacterium]
MVGVRRRCRGLLLVELLMVVALLTARAENLFAESTVPYVKRTTWRETWQTSVEAIRQADLTMGDWYYIGPFDHTEGKGFEAAYPPEKEINLGKSYSGKGGSAIRWQKGEGFIDGQVNSLSLFKDNDNIAVYVYRVIHATRPASIGISLGSDDTLTAWLNGEKLLAQNVTRACAPDQELLTVNLKEGENRLILKVCQGGGPCGFYFARADTAVLRQSIIEKLLRDFPGAAHEIMVEMDWRRQDGLTDGGERVVEAVARHLRLARQLLEDLQQQGKGSSLLTEEAEQLLTLEKEADRFRNPSSQIRNPQWEDLYLRVHRLKRDIAFRNPLLSFDKLLFVKRLPGLYSHMCDQYFGCNARPGGGIFTLESLREGGPLRNIVGNQLPEGSFLQPELSYHARKVIFAYRQEKVETPEDTFYHLYEINLDGTGLRQLTRGQYDDFDPCYLPDDRVVFISTRRGGYGRCHGRPVPLYTLHLMHADGSGIRTVSFNEANEWNPSVLEDGRIAYTRWDYVDRHAVHFQSLWTTLPSGANPQAFYGNNSINPNCTFHPRQIPGTHKVSSLAGAHHSFTAGSIIAVDNGVGLDGLKPVTRITPDVSFPESEGWPQTCYETPYPLSETYYLAAYSFDPIQTEGRPNPPGMFGLYLLDKFGNRELIYRDISISSLDPLPLRTRHKPPIIPEVAAPAERNEGRFIVLNVYSSTDRIPPDSIKALRVVRLLPKQTPLADVPRLGLAGQETGKMVLGTVPVESDGSAHFKAPAETPLLFQALDEQGMAVQTMRSLTYLRKGETLTCIGCHEPRNVGPQSRSVQAVRRSPSTIQPGPEGSAPLSFPRLVQPVLDQHCVRCHGGAKPESGLVLTGETTASFTRSYETLMNLGTEMVHRYPVWTSIVNTTPDSFGARNSRLVKMLKAGHHGVKLDRESWERLAIWLDSNALFYGTFIPEEQAKQQRGDRIAMPLY